jgi:hypothetical protein
MKERYVDLFFHGLLRPPGHEFYSKAIKDNAGFSQISSNYLSGESSSPINI